MPRLELHAAALGVELSKYLSNAILPKFYTFQIILWSDSQIVLSSVSSSKPIRQQFIQHRVQLIRDMISQSTWKYCPTTSNPADLITRGMEAKAFISKQQGLGTSFGDISQTDLYMILCLFHSAKAYSI